MRLNRSFFARDVLTVAPDLLGKTIVRVFDDDQVFRGTIRDVEAYCGEKDLGCHASRGKTSRNQALYGPPGILYVYLIYGMHWLLNIITGSEGDPQGILIRGIGSITGSGRVGKLLKIDGTFYAEDTESSRRLWFEDQEYHPQVIRTGPRIGIDYAGEWALKPWRFYIPAEQ